MSEADPPFPDPASWLDPMAVGLFPQGLRELNDTAPIIAVENSRTEVESNVPTLYALPTNWIETGIGSGSDPDCVLRSLRFVGADEITAYAEIYDGYVEALGVNGADALCSSTFENDPSESAWVASFDRVWGTR